MEYNWQVEYAKSGRSGCKACSSAIAQDSLRIATLSQAPNFDGIMQRWFHIKCYFQPAKRKKRWPSKPEEIKYFFNVRTDDQNKLRKLIAQYGGGGTATTTDDVKDDADSSSPKKKKARKSDAAADAPPKKGRGKGKRKAAEAEEETDEPAASSTAPATSSSEQPANKKPADDNAVAMRKQTDMLWKLKDAIAGELNNKQLKVLLEHNEWHVPAGGKVLDRVVDMYAFGVPRQCNVCKADDGFLVPSSDAYHCIGHPDEWANCTYKTQNPKRRPMQVPTELSTVSILCSYRYAARTRVFPQSLLEHQELVLTGKVAGSSSSSLTPEQTRAAQVNGQTQPAGKPFDGLQVCSYGLKSMKKADLQATVSELGAVYKASAFDLAFSSDAKWTTTAVYNICLADQIVPIVSENVLDFLQTKNGQSLKATEVWEILCQHKLSSWGENPFLLRLQRQSGDGKRGQAVVEENPYLRRQRELKAKEQLYISNADKVKLTVKDGGVVDHAVADEHDVTDVHVYREKQFATTSSSGLPKSHAMWATTLSSTNLHRGENKYYKLQLLESDNARGYFYLFRSWGRIGTTIGATQLDEHHSDLEHAKREFERLFWEKTGNRWSDRRSFAKQPDRMVMMDIDYDDDNNNNNNNGDAVDGINKKEVVLAGRLTKLAPSVQQLLSMIFDIKAMSEAMKEFEIDLQKMPLGKISRNQILKAYTVLKELDKKLKRIKKVEQHEVHIQGASNQFYTLIPHDTSIHMPPMLASADILKQKMDMLDSLLDMEIAFNIIDAAKQEIAGGEKDPLDVYYEKLHCKVEPLSNDHDEFEMIDKYVKQTHGHTHGTFKLKVQSAFKVERELESERFEQFSANIGNRMLLWHGSRMTNFGGILSQGLRIAPPEAPATGYMFGKGIYLADMVSKSANYCFSQLSHKVGLLLLCESALGKMHELVNSDSNLPANLPSDCQSVKGCGRTRPAAAQSVTIDDGKIEVPLGLAQQHVDKKRNLTLEYNEYIVYDVAQVRVRYLVQLEFVNR